MKPGSIVECIIDNPPYRKYVKPKTPYTVLEVINKGDCVETGDNGAKALADENGIILSEVCIPEIYYYELNMIMRQILPMKDFKELVPAIDNIEEHIKQNVQIFEPVTV